ncbi:hypothetical protein SAMN05421504_10346 [Amycolatopsis xylanica]|uniref:Uncharacterized protein n=1 Tax=Amycolatopsis xylanica TaxID=589385 RepID=A0A1H3CK36_9PSEU|nr:hypothetical protein [Amycolatopsis xylanica]SDX53954.1 hypothetical protein SAMN05421504_10346 [Amycolatopsis xylanica]
MYVPEDPRLVDPFLNRSELDTVQLRAQRLQHNPFAPPARLTEHQPRGIGVEPPSVSEVERAEDAHGKRAMLWVVLAVLLVAALLMWLAASSDGEKDQARRALARMSNVSVQDVVEQARVAGLTGLVYRHGGVADESNGADWIVDQVVVQGDEAVLHVHSGRIRPTHPYLPPSVFRQPEVHTNEGVGQVFTSWPAKPGFVTFDCARCEGETTVTTSRGDVLFRATGPYKGTRWINMDDEDPVDYYQVKATSAWTLTVADYDRLPKFYQGGQDPVGAGDSVFLYEGTKDSVRLTGVSGLDAANFSGTRVEHGRLKGPSIIQVSAAGAWSITPY